jgi:hypothetical protein
MVTGADHTRPPNLKKRCPRLDVIVQPRPHESQLRHTGKLDQIKLKEQGFTDALAITTKLSNESAKVEPGWRCFPRTRSLRRRDPETCTHPTNFRSNESSFLDYGSGV